MNFTKAFLVAILAPIPLVSHATSSEIQTQEDFETHQVFVRAYALEKNKPVPNIAEYQYGMKLDVQKVVRQTPDPKTCQVVPRLMTYEDSTGELKTVKYLALSECINKH